LSSRGNEQSAALGVTRERGLGVIKESPSGRCGA
jgi:hypothetical protein